MNKEKLISFIEDLVEAVKDENVKKINSFVEDIKQEKYDFCDVLKHLPIAYFIGYDDYASSMLEELKKHNMYLFMKCLFDIIREKINSLDEKELEDLIIYTSSLDNDHYELESLIRNILNQYVKINTIKINQKRKSQIKSKFNSIINHLFKIIDKSRLNNIMRMIDGDEEIKTIIIDNFLDNIKIDMDKYNMALDEIEQVENEIERLKIEKEMYLETKSDSESDDDDEIIQIEISLEFKEKEWNDLNNVLKQVIANMDYINKLILELIDKKIFDIVHLVLVEILENNPNPMYLHKEKIIENLKSPRFNKDNINKILEILK